MLGERTNAVGEVACEAFEPREGAALAVSLARLFGATEAD